MAATKKTVSTSPPDLSQVLAAIAVFDCEIKVTTIGTPILLTNWAIPIFIAMLVCSLLETYSF